MSEKGEKEDESVKPEAPNEQETKQTTSGARVLLFYLTKNDEVEKTTTNVHKAYRWAGQGFNFGFEEYDLTKEDYLEGNFTPPMDMED